MSNHARTIWLTRVRAALRTSFACSIVGLLTVYSPDNLKTQLKFPTLSYLTIILILIDASTLGHALSGCCHALVASIQVVPPAVLFRWLFAPAKGGGTPAGLAAMAAAAAACLVVLPECTHVTAKRIGLTLVALICTEMVVSNDSTSVGFMSPVHVGASALLGAMACLLALLLPFPGLAHWEVQKLCKAYAENASERMDIYLRAFDAPDHNTKTELVLQANPIAEMGTKLLQGIKNLQEGMLWETRHRSRSIDVEKLLQSFELPLRAMEYSLLSSSPVQPSHQQLPTTDYLALSIQLRKKIRKISQFLPSNAQTRDENLPETLYRPLESILSTQNYERGCFFFSCVDILLKNSPNDKNHNLSEKLESNITQKFKYWIKRLRSPIKYAIALGLSVLLSVTLERQNAVWASHTVAASFVVGRPAIFTVANARAQGTAVGSVYGVLCCIIFHRIELRLVALLPWIVFSTFLKHSKMYGIPGGVSAALAALFILGRNNYGDENGFAIGRLTSVFIGLFCLVFAELVVQPVRASTLAKRKLSSTLVSLQEFLRDAREENHTTLVERQRALTSFVADAESEPDFWCLPFHTSCYKTAVGCLQNTVSLLHVFMSDLEALSALQVDGVTTARKEFHQQLNIELKALQGKVHSSIVRLSLIESEDKSSDPDDEELHRIGKLSSFINEEVLRLTEEGDIKDGNPVRCLGAIGFCITSLRKEINQTEICMKEIIRWDNSST